MMKHHVMNKLNIDSSLLIKEDLKQFELDYYPEYSLVSSSG